MAYNIVLVFFCIALPVAYYDGNLPPGDAFIAAILLVLAIAHQPKNPDA